MDALAPRRVVVLVVAVLLLTALTAGAGWGFDTWWFWGGEAHKGFISQSLAGLGVQGVCIDAIADGANSQDVPMDPKFTARPQNHFDDNKIAEGAAYVEDRLQSAVQLAREAWSAPDITSRGRAWAALYCFGEGLHTAHDFYCHTNYLELLLRGGQPLAPVDYAAIPPGVRSGLFYFSQLWDNEGTAISAPPDYMVNDPEREVVEGLPEDLFVTDLVAKRGKLTAATGCAQSAHTEQQFKARLWNPTYRGALEYVTDGKQVLHYELAKDNPISLEGRILAPDGQTLYTKACGLAVATTTRHWLAFERRVRADPDQERIAAWNVAALKGLQMPALAIKELYIAAPVAAGAPLTGRLKVEITNVDRISSDPAKPFKLKVHVGATVSGTQQRGDYDIQGEGEGMGDGTYEMPLELLQMKAPDEKGEATLKLEVAFKDDPRNKTEFPEKTFEVGDAAPTDGTAAGAKRWVWVLKGGKPSVNPEGAALTDKREEPDRPAVYHQQVTDLTDRRMVYNDSGTEYGKTWNWTVDLSLPRTPPVVLERGARFDLTLKALMTKREWPRPDWPAGAGLALREDGFAIKPPPGADISEFADDDSVYVGRDPLPGGTRVETSVERTFAVSLDDTHAPQNAATTPWLTLKLEVYGPRLFPWLRYEYEARELTDPEIRALTGGR